MPAKAVAFLFLACTAWGQSSRAVAFLSHEVPAWSRDNGCFSCHNNGDAARALFVAAAHGHKVAPDVLQETSMVMWRKFDTFELGTNFFAWAVKIARFQVLKYRERQERSARLFDTSVFEKLSIEAADENIVPMVPLQALEKCLGKLSEIDRTLIRRRYQPGANVQQIAADLRSAAGQMRAAKFPLELRVIELEARKPTCELLPVSRLRGARRHSAAGEARPGSGLCRRLGD